MKPTNQTLTQLLAADLPPRFVTELIDVAKRLYPDAYDSVYLDPSIGKPEADYLLGHRRRALFESTIRNLAGSHALQVEMERPEKGGCEHVRIVTGRCSMTACHVPSGSGFPKHSLSRQQYALINEHMDQLQLFPVESNPKEAELYAIIIHSEVPGSKNALDSIRIGFPNPTFTEWVESPIDLADIADIQERIYRIEDDLQAQVQKPEPTFKEFMEREESVNP